MLKHNTFCSYCGTRFWADAINAEGDALNCASCHNPTRIEELASHAIVIAPVGQDGFIAVEREGQLVFPGGGVKVTDQSTKRGAWREFLEETGIELRLRGLIPVASYIVPAPIMIAITVYYYERRMKEATLPRFNPTTEIKRRVVVRSASQLAWPAHRRLFDFADEATPFESLDDTPLPI